MNEKGNKNIIKNMFKKVFLALATVSKKSNECHQTQVRGGTQGKCAHYLREMCYYYPKWKTGYLTLSFGLRSVAAPANTEWEGSGRGQ